MTSTLRVAALENTSGKEVFMVDLNQQVSVSIIPLESA
jgi:hypothetical protein